MGAIWRVVGRSAPFWGRYSGAVDAIPHQCSPSTGSLRTENPISAVKGGSAHLPPAPRTVAVAAVQPPREGRGLRARRPHRTMQAACRCGVRPWPIIRVTPWASTPSACGGAGPATFSPRACSRATAVARSACTQRWCTACGPDVLAEIRLDLAAAHCLWGSCAGRDKTRAAIGTVVCATAPPALALGAESSTLPPPAPHSRRR